MLGNYFPFWEGATFRMVFPQCCCKQTCQPLVNFIATSTNLNPRDGHGKQTPHEIVRNIPKYTVFARNTSQILPKYLQNTSPSFPKEAEIYSLLVVTLFFSAGALLNSM